MRGRPDPAAGGPPARSPPPAGRAATPPLPESPLWLPALSHAAGANPGSLVAASVAAATLPRAKDLKAAAAAGPRSHAGAAASSPDHRGRGLYDARALTQQTLPGFASIGARPRSKSPAPHLPAIATAGRRSASPHATAAGGAAPLKSEARQQGPEQQHQQLAGAGARLISSSTAGAGEESAAALDEKQQQQQPTAAAATAKAHPAAAHDHPDRVPGVRTGADAVAFFGRHGQDSPVKFFYCNRWVLRRNWRVV
jgi:hypothetical protein